MNVQTDIYDFLKVDMRTWLDAVYDLSAMSGDPDKPFWYLGGPMSNIRQFNFPRFDYVAARLRASGFNIVSPAELDSPSDRAAALASEDGQDHKTMTKGWSDFLMRDVVICAMPNCVGGIFIEGWEDSDGAGLETFVLDRLKKRLLRYDDSGDDFVLVPLDRDSALQFRVDEIRKKIIEAA